MYKKKISSALISVYDKTEIAPIIDQLHKDGVKFYSTGGTEKFIRGLGYEVEAVEDVTGYPSILGGRVKTLHPKVFGGILNRQELDEDQLALKNYEIPQIDLVIVDLYPFEETVASGGNEQEIVEKIDIGGIALIRAAAKNFTDVFCVSDKKDYTDFLNILINSDCAPDLDDRKRYSVKAFQTSSHYDTAIFNYFNKEEEVLKLSIRESKILRYGENPHQKGYFFGHLSNLIDQIHGKEVSYNNLLDIDAAVNLMIEFYYMEPSFAILKHNNACGFATRSNLKEAYIDALAGDPISAFGGVLIANKPIDQETATEINSLFCEVVIAPGFSKESLGLLKEKKNRILLIQKSTDLPDNTLRSCLNGLLTQNRDNKTDTKSDLEFITKKKPSVKEIEDMIFASKICKHTKSNTIVFAKNRQLISSGTGQTSRVDALNQAIEKAKQFNFDLNGAVMASDAFFPFPDCVEIAKKVGVTSILQPGGSIKDKLSIDYCNKNELSMVFTGTRHFKH
mgnify:FL=1